MMPAAKRRGQSFRSRVGDRPVIVATMRFLRAFGLILNSDFERSRRVVITLRSLSGLAFDNCSMLLLLLLSRHERAAEHKMREDGIDRSEEPRHRLAVSDGGRALRGPDFRSPVGSSRRVAHRPARPFDGAAPQAYRH